MFSIIYSDNLFQMALPVMLSLVLIARAWITKMVIGTCYKPPVQVVSINIIKSLKCNCLRYFK